MITSNVQSYISLMEMQNTMNEIRNIATDWWSVGATIFSGIITAITTMVAVIYTNYRTKKQLKEQEAKYEKERAEQFKQSKYVVIKPTLLLNSFSSLLDKIIIQNDYNRVLLFSGNDGFEFFDDAKKRASQTCRILLLENNTDNDIKEIILTTKTTLLNLNTEKRHIYETSNSASLIRGKESIVIRLTDQGQFDEILEMNKKQIPSLLDFLCEIEYSTLANQRIKYEYQIRISNDHRIEIIKDGIENVIDINTPITVTPTIFKNLQDCLSNIDRSAYSWEKMGLAQMRGIMAAQHSLNSAQQNTNDGMQSSYASKESTTDTRTA